MTTTQTGRREEGARHTPLLFPKLRLLFDGDCGVLSGPPYLVSLGEVVSIGRGPDCEHEIIFSDSRVSRTHAVIESRPDGLHLIDQGSKNGTFVSAQRVTERVLQDGDVVRVGDSFLLLRFEPIRAADAQIDGLLGSSAAACSLRAEIQRAGRLRESLLLLGESGTGKEVAAHALHRASGRSGEFVAVNCSTIPETLAETQLFGQVQGAFTEARTQPGLIRAAHGGTLFLDEVGDLPRTLQPKLLRVLEDGQVTPVGTTRPLSCDVRFIAATNRDLPRAVETDAFRGDLYTRLAGLLLRLPPLRDRREDILLLLGHFLGPSAPPLSPGLVEALLGHHWPFNIRELQRIAGELRARGAGSPLLTLDLVSHRLAPPRAPAETGERPSPPPTEEKPRPPKKARPSRQELEELLRARRGVIRQVAIELGWSNRHVRRWMEKYGLDINQFRARDPAGGSLREPLPGTDR